MEPAPHYNFKDVLWAPARALSAKQILVMTVFLLFGMALYNAFCYVGFAVDGQSIDLAFSAYHFFPPLIPDYSGWLGRASCFFGLGLAVFSLMLGFFAVSAINIEAVRGNRFFTAREATRFALSRFKQLFLAEFAIVLFVAFIVLLFFLLGLVTRIPYVGEWIFAVLFVIPNFVISLLSVFIIFVFILTVLLLPAVAAADRDGETFTGILETFSTIIRQPFRWLGYTAYSALAAKVSGFIYAYFCFRAVQFMTATASLGGGNDVVNLVRSGLGHLPYRSEFVQWILQLFPRLNFGIDLSPWVMYGAQSAVSYFMAFMLFIVFATILGYMLAVIGAAQARGYVALRFIKDGHATADEAPLFFTDENINPEVTESENKTRLG